MPLRKRKRKRHWLYAGCLVFFALALAAAIVVVNLRKPIRIVGPESQDVAALRESPKNAHKALAAIETPKVDAPEALVVPPERNPSLLQHAPGVVRTEASFLPQWASLGRILQVNRPDDDPELLAYLDSLGPMADEALSAVWRSDFYILPAQLEDEADHTLLERALLAKAVHTSRRLGRDAEALDYFLTWVRLRTFRLDMAPPPTDNGETGQHPLSIWGGVGLFAIELLSATESEELLREVLQRLDGMEAVMPSPRMLAENALRNFQKAPWRGRLRESQGNNDSDGDSLGYAIENFYWSFKRARVLRNLEKDLSGGSRAFLEALALPAPQYRKWEAQSHDFFVAWSRLGLDWRFRNVKRSEVALRSNIAKLRLILALELYEREHKVYPESLARLVPRYLPHMPIDAMMERPFHYQRQSHRYWLYQIREDRRYLRQNYVFPEPTLHPYTRDEYGEHVKALTKPRREAFIPASYLLGPYNASTEPAPRDFLTMHQKGSTPQDFAAQTGASCLPIKTDPDTGLISFGDAFSVPRAQIYYLYTQLRATRNTTGWLWYAADAQAHLWLGEDNMSLPERDALTARSFPWENSGPEGEHSGGDRLDLHPGVTPILIRIINRFGEAHVKLAFQDEEGNSPKGVTFIREP